MDLLLFMLLIADICGYAPVAMLCVGMVLFAIDGRLDELDRRNKNNSR